MTSLENIIADCPHCEACLEGTEIIPEKHYYDIDDGCERMLSITCPECLASINVRVWARLDVSVELMKP